MFWANVEPNATPRLEAAVAHAYDVFARYRLSSTIIHCDCPVCMTAETAAQLSTLSLTDIPAALLGEYTNSAHGMDDAIAPEFKHFLPRYLDLIAHCDPPSPLGLETVLTRLEGYRASWPSDEVAAIDGFFDAFVEASLAQLYLLEWPVGYRLGYDMGEVLGMVILAGGDLHRVLAVFDQAPDPDAAVHMASMRGNVAVRDGFATFENAHYDAYPEAARSVGAWLMRDCVSARIAKARATLQDPKYDGLFERGS